MDLGVPTIKQFKVQQKAKSWHRDRVFIFIVFFFDFYLSEESFPTLVFLQIFSSPEPKAHQVSAQYRQPPILKVPLKPDDQSLSDLMCSTQDTRESSMVRGKIQIKLTAMTGYFQTIPKKFT